MFYSNDKFCCMCLYESFILKLTNYDEAQPSQQGLFPQSSLYSISLSADMRWMGICRSPTRKQFILIYCLILHGWFGSHHDHGLRIRRASCQLSSTSAPLTRVFTYCLLTDLNRHTMITNHQCYQLHQRGELWFYHEPGLPLTLRLVRLSFADTVPMRLVTGSTTLLI